MGFLPTPTVIPAGPGRDVPVSGSSCRLIANRVFSENDRTFSGKRNPGGSGRGRLIFFVVYVIEKMIRIDRTLIFLGKTHIIFQV